jgi:hypothetical protein
MATLTANEVELFYDHVRNSYREGELLRAVERVCEGRVVSRVQAAMFNHASDTAEEFKSNQDEPVGIVYALFGKAAAIKYVVMDQLLHVAQDDDSALGWLNNLAGITYPALDKEDMDAYLYQSEKND